MSLKQYITEAEVKQHIPQAGDVFAIELEDGTLLETYIMSINSDTIVLDATPKMISVLREWADLEGEAGEVLFEGQFKQSMQDAAERMELDDFVERFGHMFSAGEAREFWMLANDVEDDAKLDETDYQTEIGIVDRGEYDQEGDMAKDDLATIIRAARKLTGMLDDNENMPEWVQSKINKAADYVDTAADYIESNKQQGVAEDNSETNPVARAVLNRMLMQHPGVIATHGPERVMNAIDELADYVNIGPDDEIGSSDVSGWTRDVIRMLAELPDEPLDEQGVAEGNDHSLKKVWDRYSKHLMAGRGYHTDIRQIHKSGEILQNIRKYVKDHHGQKAVDDMERYAEKQKWNEGVAEGGFDNASPMTKDTVKADRIRSLKNLIAIAKEQGRQLRVQELELELKKLQGVAEGSEQVYRVLAVDKSNALSKQVKLKVKASSLDEVFERLAVNDWYPLEINGIEVINGKRLKQDVAEMDKSQPSHGRDGKISHSTYGSRDRGGSTGREGTAKATTADKMMKHAHDVMMRNMSDADKVEKGWRNPNVKESDVAEDNMDEAKYQGREVPLGKPMRGDTKKFKVYVRDPSTGNIKKVNFGHGGTSAKRAGQKTMKIKKSDPARRRSFRARHNCDNPGSRLKARYWSCRAW